MKKSFFIYILFLLLLITLIILRLLSVSFPRDAIGHTEIIYLESFPDQGDIFEIFYEKNDFFLKPLTNFIKVNENEARSTLKIRNDDIISLENKKFIFCLFPGEYHYKKVFHRQLKEIFPDADREVHIGGWISEEKRLHLSAETDRQLLKNLIVEIAPSLLRKLIPANTGFSGKLLCIKRNPKKDRDRGIMDGIVESIQVASPHMEMKRIRNFRMEPVRANTTVNIESGDILQFGNPLSKTDLSLKFNLQRVKSKILTGNRGEEKLVPSDITSLIISYRETDPTYKDRQPFMVFLKSFESDQYFPIDKRKINRFLGDQSLFRFNLMPDQLLDRQYIPENIHEGGIMDMKELLDRDLLYRKDDQFYPVDLPFLQKVKNRAAQGIGSFRKYLENSRIEWRHFSHRSEMQEYVKNSERVLKKMMRKGTWYRFSREITQLNNVYSLNGVGIEAGEGLSFQVFYRIPGLSWVRAQPWKSDIPEVLGIDSFYWGSLIKDSDDAEFRFDFSDVPPDFRLISVADYAYSFDGRNYNKRNFFDGIQNIHFALGRRQLFVKVANVFRFNQEITQAGFQMRIILKKENAVETVINTDKSWTSSIDLSSWIPVKINPLLISADNRLRGMKSIWYDEQWNPLYSGVKNRYFKKEFKLQSTPEQASWKINAPGEYLFWINNHMIRNENDLKQALVPGKNRLIVMCSRKGFSKTIRGSDLFIVRNNRVQLKSRKIYRSSFIRGKQSQKPVLLDIQNKVLGFSSSINGNFQRFFNSVAQDELQFIIGSDPNNIWGLEQVFRQVNQENRVAEIQLTIDQEWQKIAVRNIQMVLQENKKREISSSRYCQLSEQLGEVEKQLSSARSEMGKRDGENIQSLMEKIIGFQDRIDQLRTEINKIKNYFYEASVVLLNPRGQILVAASLPYNEKTMEALNTEVRKPYGAYEIPFLNRAWKWKYNPGSTAKILDSISFLSSAPLSADTRTQSEFPYVRRLLDPRINFTGFPRTDLKGCRMLNGKQVFFQLQNFRGHDIPPGFCSLSQALTHSYNTYFGYVALHNHRMLTEDSTLFKSDHYFISRSLIPKEQAYREYPVLHFAEKLLMNQRIDLLSNLEKTPVFDRLLRRPVDAFFAHESIYPVNAYTPSDIAYFSIGQSDFQLTTLQNALIVSTILNRGCLYYPSIIKAIRFKDSKKQPGMVLEPDPETEKTRIFAEEIADSIKEAMKNVVDQGTAAGVFDNDLRKDRIFYAKTGTAEIKFYPDHSLFIGFVRFRNGTHTIFSVIVPRSGTGAAVAGRLTARILKDIIDWENKNQSKL